MSKTDNIINYKAADKVYAARLGLTGICTIVRVGPPPAEHKLGADWAKETYDIREDRTGVVVLAAVATDLRPAR